MSNKKAPFNITIEFHSLIRDLVKNLWCVVLAALIGLMGTYCADTLVYSPEYTSSCTLVVTTKLGNNSSYSNVSIAAEMAKIFAEVFVQPSLKGRAAENAGYGSFGGKVSASVSEGTNIIQLSVTTADPERSLRLLNSLLVVHPEITEMVVADAFVSVLKTPSMPKRPSNSLSSHNKSIIIFSCIMLCLFAILLMSILRDTVKDEKSFNDKIESKLLGTVIHERKTMSLIDRIRGKKMGLLIHGTTMVSLRFSESFHKLSTKLEYLNRKNGSNNLRC